MQQRAWTACRRNLGLLLLIVLVASAAEAQQIQVNSADPPAAEQGTVNLNVSIKGKGFKKGAAASFVLTGTDDPDGVAVNSTTFVSAGELVANITVAETAAISKFDIKVRNSDGRIGKGTELFSVLAKGSGNTSDCPSCTSEDVPVVSVLEDQDAATQSAFRIHSDGGGAYIEYSLNSSPKRGDYLLSRVFGPTGDWVVDTNKASTYPRNVYLDLRDGVGPIDAELLLPARVLVRCVRSDEPTWSDGGLLAMSAAVPQKKNCRLGVGFTHEGTTYSLLLGPYDSGDATWVTCTGFSSDGSACTSWQIEAGTYDAVSNPSGNPGTVAWLTVKSKGGKETKVGEYNVSFRFQVAR